MKPKFPLKIRYHETGEEDTFDDELDVAQNLEWFDSENHKERAEVTDSEGRPVRLKVEKLDVLVCELAGLA